MKRNIAILLTLLLLISSVLPVYAADSIGQLSASINSNTRIVTVSGQISSGAGKEITLKVTDPDGDLEYIGQTTSGNNGSFNIQFKLSGVIAGTYNVKVGGQGIAVPIAAAFSYSLSNPPAGGGGNGGGNGGGGNGGGGSNSGGGSSAPSVPTVTPPAVAIPPANITLQEFEKRVEEAVQQNNNRSNTTEVEITVNDKVDPNDEISIVLPAGAMEIAQKNKVGQIEVISSSRAVAISMRPDALGSEALNNEITIKVKTLETSSLPSTTAGRIDKEAKVIDLKAYIGEKQINTFEKPIKVGIPYMLKPGELPNMITVYNLKDDGTLENFGGTYDSTLGMVFFSTGHFSKYLAMVVKPKAFIDMKGYEWAKNSIEEMNAKGYINGTGSTTYSPKANITRAEAYAIFVRMLKYRSKADILPYKKVTKDKWYYDDVKAAYENSLIINKESAEFNPASPISRIETASVIASILKNSGYVIEANSTMKFSDEDQIPSWAVEYAKLAANKGIVKGSDGKFRPNDSITRAEFAVMIKRLNDIR